jgi:hypothetical protein
MVGTDGPSNQWKFEQLSLLGRGRIVGKLAIKSSNFLVDNAQYFESD